MRIVLTRGSFPHRVWVAAGPSERRQLDTARQANDALQDWVSRNGECLPSDLLKLLSDVDHALHVLTVR